MTYLNKLFPTITAAKKGKELWRPSRSESRDALLLFVKVSLYLKNQGRG